MTHRIVIVGGGFSGTVLAAHLLRRSPAAPLAITLIERAAEIGRGVAYAVRDWPYLLNVPAGRMSADSAAPLQFVHYAQRKRSDVSADEYLERQLYGDYLQEFLRDAERLAASAGRLERLHGEVTAIRARPGVGFDVQVVGGAPVAADSVVLALGTPPPRELAWMSGLMDHPGYHATPWTLPRRLGADQKVLIVGNGLSMADAVLSLCDDPEHTPQFISISRRGLIPHAQSTGAAAHGEIDLSALSRASTARTMLATGRALAREHMQQGGDWRDVITAIRHRIPLLWQRLSLPERARFVRHAQSHWDVHRHRLPPQMGSRLNALARSGQLVVTAGRVLDARLEAGQIRMTWASRRDGRSRSQRVDVVVNALGPEYSIARSREALVRSLRDSGMICEDAARLGLLTGADAQCIRADGGVTGGIYYLGPMLRAGCWEATAANELRDHAERLARHLSSRASEPVEVTT